VVGNWRWMRWLGNSGVSGAAKTDGRYRGAMTKSTGRPRQSSSTTAQSPPLRLGHDRFVGGVCAGFAAYLGINVAVTRLAMAAFVTFGPGLLMYLVLWLSLPAADGGPAVLQHWEARPQPSPVRSRRRTGGRGYGRGTY
jgi:phage shock protein PspC (stress-responsive transcriptional regulator)